MRTSLYVTIRGEKISAEPIDVVEGKARFKAEAANRPEGVTEIQRWTSDGGIVSRKKFGEAKIESAGPTFAQGSEALQKQVAENQRRLAAGLPTLEEEQEAAARRKPAPQTTPAPKADQSDSPAKEQDHERKPRARKAA